MTINELITALRNIDPKLRDKEAVLLSSGYSDQGDPQEYVIAVNVTDDEERTSPNVVVHNTFPETKMIRA